MLQATKYFKNYENLENFYVKNLDNIILNEYIL